MPVKAFNYYQVYLLVLLRCICLQPWTFDLRLCVFNAKALFRRQHPTPN